MLRGLVLLIVMLVLLLLLMMMLGFMLLVQVVMMIVAGGQWLGLKVVLLVVVLVIRVLQLELLLLMLVLLCLVMDWIELVGRLDDRCQGAGCYRHRRAQTVTCWMLMGVGLRQGLIGVGKLRVNRLLVLL